MAQSPTSLDSVHRYPIHGHRPSADLAQLYWTWLDAAWGPLVSVELGVESVRIRLLGLPVIVLHTEAGGDYTVRGGLLARPGGRFCFHSTSELAVAALLDFRPVLPIWLYRPTHRAMHEWTMRRFGRHLAELDAALHEPQP